MAKRERGPRERMVMSAAELIRRDGVSATGVRDVVEHAGAPRGSVQHYFPGGKVQLVNEAVAWVGSYTARRIVRYVEALERPTPGALFTEMTDKWAAELTATGFAGGCTIAAATVDWADSTESTRTAAAAAFAAWTRPLADALTGMGVPETRSEDLATLMLSTLEGALLIARAERDVRALTSAARELAPMLDGAVP
ncbi:TetR/AcrR family transcriptional regulator [Streptomyces sp. A7024]|uniref:TetR/AcrR family transcriptional regulator n=1 Tax=Streptomyces coryli TaxID=1128680 RepID=A0A6G4UBB8_9ACTN|nr:TetR/AcrR family transcriptional regulator [Streptomyces coryli]NGN69519.1 TetR/AcrR family transcriptional regulator [Streptomyces coryli]